MIRFEIVTMLIDPETKKQFDDQPISTPNINKQHRKVLRGCNGVGLPTKNKNSLILEDFV